MSKSENKKSAPPKTPVASKAGNATKQMEPAPQMLVSVPLYVVTMGMPGFVTYLICNSTGLGLARVQNKNIAELICRAVNNHEELLAALKEINGHLYDKQNMARCRDLAAVAIANAEKA